MNLDKYVFGDNESKTTLQMIVEDRLDVTKNEKHRVILYGVTGSGKTTLAQDLCLAIESVKGGSPVEWNRMPDVYKVHPKNCALVVADISSKNDLGGNRSGLDYIILDKVDNMNANSQANLIQLMTLPKFSDNYIFIMTAQSLDDVDDGIKNGCHCINMNMGDEAEYTRLLFELTQNEYNVDLPDGCIAKIVSEGGGSWRKMNSDLDIEVMMAGVLPVNYKLLAKMGKNK